MTLANGLELTGIHHVSSITSNLAANRDFYTRALGMRLVKKTVNQDATDVYHLFYADGLGSAGSDVTFFGFPSTPLNQPGAGEIAEYTLRVSNEASLAYWTERFDTLGIEHQPLTERAGFTALPFTDPEGQRMSLIADDGRARIPGGTPWEKSTVPVEHGIIGLGTVSITTGRPDATLNLLTGIMGFRIVEDRPDPALPDNRTIVLETGSGGPNATMIVNARPNAPRARLGHGGVHHVAFRVPTFEAHTAWNDYLTSAGIGVTPVIDRFYFRAMYFREPGGVLFEISSDLPGFATDEPLESLGESLALPPFLEPRRAEIEAQIVPLDTSQRITTREYGLSVETITS
jgi:glyoxalase family protein